MSSLRHHHSSRGVNNLLNLSQGGDSSNNKDGLRKPMTIVLCGVAKGKKISIGLLCK